MKHEIRKKKYNSSVVLLLLFSFFIAFVVDFYIGDKDLYYLVGIGFTILMLILFLLLTKREVKSNER